LFQTSWISPDFTLFACTFQYYPSTEGVFDYYSDVTVNTVCLTKMFAVLLSMTRQRDNAIGQCVHE